METGWTWEYIDDHMDLPRLSAMNRYWENHPPVHIMLKKLGIWAGIEKPPKSKSFDADPLAQMFMSGSGSL
jgi:hypothetical protein